MHGARAKLTKVLRDTTVPLFSPDGAEGTGFFVAPGVVLTCAHVITDPGGGIAEAVHSVATDQVPATEFHLIPGSYHANDPSNQDLVLLQTTESDAGAHVLLCSEVEPDDPLWAFGYPMGRYRTGDSVTLTLAGPSWHVEGAELWKTVRGPITPGFSGGPVLNWRTGAVCGVIRYRDTAYGDTARLIPAHSVFAVYPDLEPIHQQASPGTHGWLELLDDEQISQVNIRFPGPRLRKYLEAASTADDRHPHAELAGAELTPPLWKVYLRQQTSRYNVSADAGTAERIDADSLLWSYPGVQVLGGPGAGKSSLVRHLTAEIAKQWLRGEYGEFVPVPVPADALTTRCGIPEMLAKGAQSFDLDLDRQWLKELFTNTPASGARWLVLADGLDEIVDHSDRQTVVKLIKRQRSQGQLTFLLTTRPTGVNYHIELSENGSYPTFVIEPFARHQLGQFAKSWFETLEVQDADVESSRFVSRVGEAGLRDLATIPLIATMMCLLYAQDPGRRLPSSRVDLYRQFVELLLAKRRLKARRLLREWGGRSGKKTEQAVDLLFDDALRVLREWAYTNYEATTAISPTGKPQPTLVEVASQYVKCPDDSVSESEWTRIVHEVFLSTSLLISRRGGPEFLHQTILEYLAACRQAQRHPRPRRKQLAPRSLPWKNWEVELFLVGLWSDNGKDITRVLNRLLRRRYWDINYGFVVDVMRQGIPLPGKVRTNLLKGLVEHVTRPTRLDEWRTAVMALADLDPGLAATSLGVVLRKDGESAARIEALRLLLEVDRGRGVREAEVFVFAGRVAAEERLRAAKTVLEVDRSHGVLILTRLADAPELQELRFEAAQLVLGEDTAKGLAILNRQVEDPSCPEKTRLTAAETICAQDSGRIPTTLALLCRDRDLLFETRYAAAKAVMRLQDDLSAELLAALAEEPSLDPGFRRRAGRTLGDVNPLLAIRILENLASSIEWDAAERVDAAAALAEVDPETGLVALFKLADDLKLEAWRVDAAKAAALYPEARSHALELLEALVVDAAIEFAIRRFAAHTLYDLDLTRGISALTELATTSANPHDRLDAMEDLAADRDRGRAVSLLNEVVASKTEPAHTKERAAKKLSSLAPELTVSIYTTLAQDASFPITQRVDFAVKVTKSDRTRGITLIKDLIAVAPSPQILDLIDRLESIDRASAVAEYRQVAASTRADRRTRWRAANRANEIDPPRENHSQSQPSSGSTIDDDISHLSKRRQLQLRVTQAGDKKLRPEERLTAAEAAAKLNPAEGKAALQALINDRKTPKPVRTKAERALRRIC